MILGLFLTIIGLTIGAWIVVMYIWWKEERGEKTTLATDVAFDYFEKCARLTRRGWYASALYARTLGMWGNKKASKLFFRLFPDAAPAFAKRDALLGLTQGPSSFFLLSISEEQKRKAKKSLTAKKIV